MRIWFGILGAATMLAAGGMVVSATRAQTAPQTNPATAWTAVTAHDFTLTRIDGRPLPMQAYRGKVVLLVNTASMCGFTPQYEGLQKLQKDYGPRGFTVIGVPSGDFGGQEHDSADKIVEFCETNFGITFPLTEKSSVTGPRAAPIYQWAKATLASQNVPKWNFHKFLIGKDGRLIAGYHSKVRPDSPEMKRAIETALRS
ncbi:MAG: glutathione peroxidase [Sandarakinorhabdus sp.]|nr:glutathione peroxidase [Sandarakinorhabdus sp.]